MKLAIYHPWVYLKGGIERTLVELLSRSRHDWTLFTNHYAGKDTFPEFGRFRVVELPRVSVHRSAWAVAKSCVTLLTQRLDFSAFDALFICSEGLGDLVALRPASTPVACLCFTPLKAAHDEYAGERLRRRSGTLLLERAGMRLFSMVDRLAWKRYRRVFCISAEVRHRVLRARLADPERLEILHPGVDIDRLQPSEVMESFFLLPGRIMWSKNIELAIDAFREFRRNGGQDRAFRLVIAGMVDEKSRPYLEELRSRAAGERIEFVTSPTDGELFDLYRRCRAVVFPPPNEDWGLVPLEAMAFGKPVIAVDRGGPRETVDHEVTGLLCSDGSAAPFADAMYRLCNRDEAARMGRAGRRRAVEFGWDVFVDRLDGYAEELAGGVMTSEEEQTSVGMAAGP